MNYTFEGIQIPPRKVIPLGKFESIGSLQKVHEEPAQAVPTEAAVGSLANSQDARTKVCFVIHEPQDGSISADALSAALEQDSRELKVQQWGRNDRGDLLDADDLCLFFKKKSVIRVAKEHGLWNQPSLLTEAKIGLVSLIVTVLLSVAAPVMQFAIDLLQGYVWLAFSLLFGGLAVVSAAITVQKHRQSCSRALRQLADQVERMPLEEYARLVSYFDTEDFLCYKLNYSDDKEIAIVKCVPYHTRHYALLERYLAGAPEGQFWVIFLERKKVYDPLIHHRGPGADHRCYYLVPLNKRQKKELASKVADTRLSDPHLRNLGIDYIFKNYINRMGTEHETGEDLLERINGFVEERRQDGFTADIRALIVFIAQLKCYFFASGVADQRCWEILFDYNSESALNRADLELSHELLFTAANRNAEDVRLSDLKKLTVGIVNKFEDDFSNILVNPKLMENCPDNLDWSLLLLIKVLKYRGMAEARCNSATDYLFTLVPADRRESGWKQDFRTEQWQAVFVELLGLLREARAYWLVPHLLHLAVEIYEGTGSAVFAADHVLWAARCGALLCPDTDDSDLDMIADHCRVLRGAVAVSKRGDQFRLTSDWPDSFSILNLSDEDRAFYFSALTFFGEQVVLQYYEYLFDAYCTNVRVTFTADRMDQLSDRVRKNDLHSKYYDAERRSDDLHKYYLSTIVCRLCGLLAEEYREDEELRQLLQELSDISRSAPEEGEEQLLLLLISRAEFSACATSVFLSCLITFVRRKTVGKSTVLGMGGYLLRTVFLMEWMAGETFIFNDDTKLLIELLINYLQPKDPVLAFLICFTSYPCPQGILDEIISYLEQNRAACDEAIATAIRNSSMEMLEDSISMICTIGCIQEERKSKFYQLIRDRVEEGQYAQSEAAAHCKELLSVYLDNRIHPALEGVSPEEIVRRMQTGYRPNSVKMLYSFYCEKDAAAFLPYCPLLLEQLKNSTRVAKYSEVLDYVDGPRDRDSEDFAAAVKVLYNFYGRWENSCPNDWVTKKIIKFFRMLESETDAHLLAWEVEREKLSRYLELHRSTLDRLHLARARAYFFHRRFSRYGLYQYIKYMLNRFYEAVPADYSGLEEEKRIDYLIAHFDQITPFIMEEDKHRCNRAYLDLLDAVIHNTRNIQASISEARMMEKASRDVHVIIDAFPSYSSKVREQIYQMIEQYKKQLQ